jgi:hypothetical protein
MTGVLRDGDYASSVMKHLATPLYAEDHSTMWDGNEVSPILQWSLCALCHCYLPIKP